MMKTDSQEHAGYVVLFLLLVILPAAIPVYLNVLNTCLGVSPVGVGSLLYVIPIANVVSYVWAVAIGFPGILLLQRMGRLSPWMVLISLLAPAGVSLILICLFLDYRIQDGLDLLVLIALGVLLSTLCLWLISRCIRKARGLDAVIILTLLAWLAFYSYVAVYFHHYWVFEASRRSPRSDVLLSLVRSWFGPSLIIAVVLSCVWGIFYLRHRDSPTPAATQE